MNMGFPITDRRRRLLLAVACTHGHITDNPGQNSLAKRILFPYFSKYCPKSTLYKILRTLVPPPTSMLLFSVKSLRRNMFICANNIDIEERGVI